MTEAKSAEELIELDRRVLEHIGRIVRNASDIEENVAELISIIVNPDDLRTVHPLVAGVRLSDLITSLGKVMPDFDDRAQLFKALERVNRYRDRLAHSTRDMFKGDYTSATVQWMSRYRRAGRDTMRLEVSEMETKEREHYTVLGVVQAYFMTLLLKNPQLTTLRDTVAQRDMSGGPEPFMVVADRWVFKPVAEVE